MSDNIPKVTIIVLNWNGARHTLSCLYSLAKTTYSNYSVMVIDNGSSDDSVASIRSAFPELQLLETGQNLGYAGGNNVGIREALTQGAEYVWILNNDTVVDPRCLQHMVETAELDRSIGMVGSKIYYLDAPQTIWYAGGTVDLRCGSTGHIGKDETDQGQYDVRCETEFITGCSMLVPRQVVEAIGLMDESYFLYFEDVDWSLKARQVGWKLCLEPKAVLFHAEGAQTAGCYSDRFIYYTLRNRLYFMQRFAPKNMLGCHLMQIKTALYFAISASKVSWKSSARALALSMESYADYYVHRRMGHKEL
jgi:GT2 family glycosyltransferase